MYQNFLDVPSSSMNPPSSVVFDPPYSEMDNEMISSPKLGANPNFSITDYPPSDFNDNLKVADIFYTSFVPFSLRKKKPKRKKMPIILRPFLSPDATEITVARLKKMNEEYKKNAESK